MSDRCSTAGGLMWTGHMEGVGGLRQAWIEEHGSTWTERMKERGKGMYGSAKHDE